MADTEHETGVRCSLSAEPICWEMDWNRKEKKLTITFRDSWWDKSGDIKCIPPGQAKIMSLRDADVLHFTKRLNQIATKGDFDD